MGSKDCPCPAHSGLRTENGEGLDRKRKGGHEPTSHNETFSIMKNFILKNAMVVAAMAIAAGSYGLMSFGTTGAKFVQTSNWYEVDANGNISTTPMLTPPSDSPTAACSTAKQVNTCALQIELDPNHPFPETEEDARADHVVLSEAFSAYE